MNGCADRELAIQALADGELDSLNSAELETHLRDCSACAAALDRVVEVKTLLTTAAPRFRAPAALRERVEALVENGPALASAPKPASPPRRLDAWLGGGAIGALAASLALVFAAPQLTTVALQDQLIASHVRSLQASHLVDVATSDRHVVKPWFNGRIDFAPPVVELAAKGFPLVGGRLDYIAGRPVAALVYRRRLHSINLFVRPAAPSASPVPASARHDGYALTRWVSGGLEFWAVSDVELADLEAFRSAFQQATRT